MNKTLKKIVSLAAAVTIVGAMTAVSFADTPTYSNEPNVTNETTLNIPKTLKVKNPDSNVTKVDGPGLTYNYVISPQEPAAGNGGTTITDKDTPTAHTGTVHTGPEDSVTLSTAAVAFPVGTTLNASQSGADNTKNITASVDLDKFGTKPGIYRYKITESASVTPSSVGVTDSDAAEVRYLDVYIERDDAQNATKPVKVAGYVVHTGTTEDGAPSDKKTFDTSVMETYNVTLNNQVKGSMGDRGNEFPFAGKVVDNGRSFYAKKGEAPASSQDNTIAGVAAGSDISVKLAHGQTYYISGLTDQATVKYTETNDTDDTYQVEIKNGDDSLIANSPASVSPAGTATMDNAQIAFNKANAVVFTNTLENVSPTGVLFRYGAPLLVLAAAGALYMLNRRSRKNEAAC